MKLKVYLNSLEDKKESIQAIYDNIYSELVDIDALDKWQHMTQQLLNGEELTQAERQPSGLDPANIKVDKLFQQKAEEFTTIIIELMTIKEFNYWIMDVEHLKIVASKLKI